MRGDPEQVLRCSFQQQPLALEEGLRSRLDEIIEQSGRRRTKHLRVRIPARPERFLGLPLPCLFQLTLVQVTMAQLLAETILLGLEQMVQHTGFFSRRTAREFLPILPLAPP